MKVTATDLPGVLLVEPRVFADNRGQFWESFRTEPFATADLPTTFAQDNVSVSFRGVVRGLHLQHPHGQAKLVSVLEGEVFDVAVDVRPGSPTFGRWVGVTLSSLAPRLLYIPSGFAHGFAVLSERATFHYKCTDVYHPEAELGVRWDDPDLSIAWPVTDATLSRKDADLPRLRDIPREKLPAYST
jgi:dTDP-4-dehydrorhamnose 3,5-epimerase